MVCFSLNNNNMIEDLLEFIEHELDELEVHEFRKEVIDELGAERWERILLKMLDTINGGGL